MSASSSSKLIRIPATGTSILPTIQSQIDDYEFQARVNRRITTGIFAALIISVIVFFVALAMDNVPLLFISSGFFLLSGFASILMVPTDKL